MSGATRYRFLTSGGPLAAVTLVVLDAAVVAESRAWWRGDGLWGIQQFGSSLIIGLPVLLVLFALPPVLRGGVSVDEALLPVRLWRARLIRFAVDVATVLAAHLAFVGFALVYAISNGDRPDWPSALISVLTQVLAILFVSALGRAVGEVVRHPAAIFVAALAGVLLAAFGANALRVSAGSSPYAGLALAPRGYAVAALVLGVALVLVLSRPNARRLGGVGVAAAAVLVLLTGQLLGEPSVRASGTAPSDCHSAEGTPVCVFPGYGFMAEGLVADVRNSLLALRKNGINPHLERVAQSVPGVVEPAGTIAISFDSGSLETGSLVPAMVRGSLIHPSWCPRINSPRVLPRSFDRAQQAVYHWLEHAEGATSDKEYALAVPDFARLPEAEQKRFVQDFFDRNIACEGLS